ncbi:MAG TPA: 16S rRNA (cytidine(1402)-2'-O)-methyltransferase [Pirellulaceae bacterium]|nr:16S rRNA (cytidine(1402)-2'-O)-methyltransferase [Pirellulaceae bacterium]
MSFDIGPVRSERRPAGQRESKGVLYVVATPIGNLEDITLRALKVLKLVELVAAEDTRRTGNLLRHFGVEASILSVHEHNERTRIDRLVSHLAKGESVALVTDAGTPGISDPGAALVAAVRAAGFRIEPIPGPSAVIAAISASGITSQGFTFLGFPPIRSKDRKQWFADLHAATQSRLAVFYEAPHKVRKTLQELDLLVKRPIIIARELTKIHEEFVRGTPGELAVRFSDPYGEFTVLVPPRDPAEKAANVVSDEDVVATFGQIAESNQAASKRAVAKRVGERLGMTAKQVYGIIERNK